MANNNDKYGRNRNLWRKVYGSINRPPDVRTIIDEATATTYSLDVSKTVRDRNFFMIVQNQVTGSEAGGVTLGEYDEGLITFDGETEKAAVFNFTFSNKPTVVFTVEETSPSAAPNSENIAVYGLAITITGSDCALSAPFSGTIRYRAAFAAAYPAYFTSAFAPVSGIFRASAGSMSVSNHFYTASYAAMSNPPTSFRQSPFDVNGNFLADVKYEVIGSPGATETVTELSAPLDNNDINFIAYE